MGSLLTVFLNTCGINNDDVDLNDDYNDPDYIKQDENDIIYDYKLYNIGEEHV